MSLWSNCAECTFLSSETWIKLYMSGRCVWVSPCARHDFWACSMSDTFTFQTKARPKNSGVNVISCLRFCFSERKWACFCSLCAPFLDSFCVFPSTFFSPHLFLLLLDTARPIPPFSPTLSSHNFPMHTTFPPFLLFSFPPLLLSLPLPHARVHHSPGCPSSQHHERLCRTGGWTVPGSGTCYRQCVFKRFIC